MSDPAPETPKPPAPRPPEFDSTQVPTRSLGQPSMATIEYIVAGLLVLIGALVARNSWQLGAGWSELRGPGAGYFPFWLGLLLCASGLSVIGRTIWRREKLRQRFIEMVQLVPVLVVFLPTVAYIAGMQWLGFYVASAVFVACFMRFAGNMAWWKCLTCSVLPMIGLFWLFEKQFIVPLPKGPVEAWLGSLLQAWFGS